MSQSQVREPNSFGKRKKQHSIIITRNGRSRHYSVNPLYFSLLAGIVAMFGIGYFAATTYLIFRDDLISATGARSARIQHEYEDRIAALRSNLDRITSRQLLDQQAIEKKVNELIERQEQLRARGPAMKSILEKASALGLDIPGPNIPKLGTDTTITGSIPKSNLKSVGKDKQALVSPALDGLFSLRGVGREHKLAMNAPNLAMNATLGANQITIAGSLTKNIYQSKDFSYKLDNPLFTQMARSIQEIDAKNKLLISSLRISANDRISKFAALMKKVGVDLSPIGLQQDNTQIGGPYEPIDQKMNFSSQLVTLNNSLVALGNARTKVDLVPVNNPLPGKSMSSKFGTRLDPFKGTHAMHSGIDFRAKTGAIVKAAADGMVIHASNRLGYGKMIEIRHSDGLTTRYAHLSKIMVKVGQSIKSGINIGKVGSTGRSTGPHLHYEIRRSDVAINPKKYLGVGKKLARLL